MLLVQCNVLTNTLFRREFEMQRMYEGRNINLLINEINAFLEDSEMFRRRRFEPPEIFVRRIREGLDNTIYYSFTFSLLEFKIRYNPNFWLKLISSFLLYLIFCLFNIPSYIISLNAFRRYDELMNFNIENPYFNLI